MLDKELATATRFFAAHADYSTPPGRMACALELAKAEREAEERGWYCEWEFDEWGDLGDHDYWCRPKCGREHETLNCLLRDAERNVLGSLGSIIDPDSNYRRVIEAELASQALHHEKQAARYMAF